MEALPFNWLGVGEAGLHQANSPIGIGRAKSGIADWTDPR